MGGGDVQQEDTDQRIEPQHIVQPDWLWQPFLEGPFPVPTIRRPRLDTQVLNARQRWVAVVSMPGVGRSTLLTHAAETLEQRGEAFALVERGEDRFDFLRQYGLAPDASIDQAVAEVTQRIEASGTPQFTLLIDDFDWFVVDGTDHLIFALMAAVPGLRLVTTSVQGITPLPHLAETIEAPYEIRLDQLVFTFEETKQVYEAHTQDDRQQPEFREDELHRLFEETAGIPIGVTIAIDRSRHPGSQRKEGFTLAFALAAIRSALLTDTPRDILTGPFGDLYYTMTFLPRFTAEKVFLIVPNTDRSAADDLFASPLLRQRKSIRAYEYVWADSAWRAFLQWNAGAEDRRRQLALELLREGRAPAAFEQWLFAGDLDSADRLARERFLSVYEGLTPEGVLALTGIPRRRLRRHPHLDILLALLAPESDRDQLYECIDRLARIAKRAPSPYAALMSLATRGALLAKLSDRAAAVRQANIVLARAVELEESAIEEQVVTLAEAKTLAVLTFLSCRTLPKDPVDLGPALGEQLLDHRSRLAAQLLNVLRGGENAGGCPYEVCQAARAVSDLVLGW
ncbi:hypothetical protein ACIGCK_14630 [Microbacterium sp. NPDC078428]|uniref:hypothetical protein n=1 Tax=Microbacterium sp. NPDC078428 TaxID=3364190 RepID=UPI0037C5BB80